MLEIPFERNKNYSATYTEVMSFFHNAAQCSEMTSFVEFGTSDSGKPLSMFIVDKTGNFQPLEVNDKRAVLLLNNGIHPGEPCGIEASMLLVRDILIHNLFEDVLDDVVILIIPVYNIGGMLNRNSFSRANQNGPEAYGFRGNAKNLDLNRDFIKADSRNTQSIHKLFNRWSPDMFIDTHTSNGADYSYTMTLIANMYDRLAPPLQKLVFDEMLPQVYNEMANAGWEMVPYVNAQTTPDEGIAAFNDLPRYSMGFGAVHHIPSFTTEAHMLKPYEDRVLSTYKFFEVMTKFTAKNRKKVKQAIKQSKDFYRNQTTIPIDWELNKEEESKLTFKGYEAKNKPSEVSGQDRLFYDRENPFEKEIPFWKRYKVKNEIEIPHTYVVPQAYEEIIERLRMNGVVIHRSRRDSTTTSKSYRINSFETVKSPYEGHYLHHQVKASEEVMEYQIRRGDYIIKTDQDARRYIIETLEPEAPDSYFAWNFFDGILMQKEYFSPYVFEDEAARLLRTNATLKKEFEEKKAKDESFAKNWYAQLDYIYKASIHYEKTHNLYPVGRLFE